MKTLYTQIEFDNSKSTDKLPCECYNCGKTFYRMKKEIKQEINHKRGRVKFCSQICNNMVNNKSTKIKIQCTNCGLTFKRTASQVGHNNYCSNSCNATYCNKNKKHGTRRSRLEIWVEKQLITLYPKLDIHFNKKDAIGSELDIYIPSLNIAFELNGIFHYEPIYGVDKLQKIQENDISKSKACHDAKIDLCVIDTSGQTYVKPKTSKKYLDIITNIIKERLTS